MVYALASISALGFALASVNQYRASQDESKDLNLSFRLLARLVRNVSFLKGAIFDVVGVSGQFIALLLGPLAVVQPILAGGLVIAVLIEHRFSIHGIGGWELVAIIVAALSLATFEILRGPTGGGEIHRSASIWFAVGVAMLAGGLLLGSSLKLFRAHGLSQAAIAGTSLGMVAVLEREVGVRIHGGLGMLLGSWQIWALILFAPVALLLVQSAFQKGELKRVLPVVAVTEPVTALFFGHFCVGERIFPAHILLVGILLLAALLVSVFLLAVQESPNLHFVGGGSDGDEQSSSG